MAAPLGNRFWEARSSHGRKPKFPTPDDMWSAAVEYFEWVEDNPLWESKAFAYQGEVTIASVPKMRAMTIQGLCIFLDISRQNWTEYVARNGFSEITAKIEDVIRSQTCAGAAADLLNANIIARDLGLADKSEISGKEGSLVLSTTTDGTMKVAAAVTEAVVAYAVNAGGRQIMAAFPH